MVPDIDGVSRVTRTKAQARKNYDRMSPFYDCVAGVFEQKYRTAVLNRLGVSHGDTVLEIGFGTGHGLKELAQEVGEEGRVYGIDISPRMCALSIRRLKKSGLRKRVELICDDAMTMPYANNSFDAVCVSFTLELFDSPEIPVVLSEIRRVLKPEGHLGIVTMSKAHGTSFLLRLYEWLHRKLPEFVDCRPIYGEQSLKQSGFHILEKVRVSVAGLPGDILIGTTGAGVTASGGGCVAAGGDARAAGTPEFNSDRR